MTFTAQDIAQRLGGQVVGDGAMRLTGFAQASSAKAGDLTFAENAEYFAAAEQSAAAAILVSGDFTSATKTLIKVANARVAFARALPLFFPEKAPAAGIHPTAAIASSARVAASAHIGPHCVIGESTVIGERCVLTGGNHVGDRSRLGDDTRLFPNVVIYHDIVIGQRVRIHASTVIGADGFGYVFDAGQHVKIPQVGNVVIGDDVEIGACVCIDRAALGSTVIGKGTKIDNLVQVAHNVVIGEHCLVLGQVGIAGSTRLGHYVTIASQSGVAGHLTINDRAVVMAKAGVMTDIPAGERYVGAPAGPDRQVKRQLIALQQLPELIKRVRELERRLPPAAGGA
jgi:UDP-3-O-[3-hydroxymyristoyl] glucosamine N-acyltransferase